VIVWDVRTGAEVRRFGGPQEQFDSLAVSPNGRYCLAAGKSAVHLYEVATGQEIRQFGGSATKYASDGTNYRMEIKPAVAAQAGAVCFSGDGQRVLAAAGKEILVWNLLGKELRRFKTIPANESVEGMAFSGDGKRAVTLSHHETLRAWDVEKGKILFTAEKLENPHSVALSTDGSRALVGTWGGDLLYWDLDAGKELRRYKGHSSIIKSVALSPDGSHALTGGWDKTVRFWELEK
jgi:WD40 repeat protein